MSSYRKYAVLLALLFTAFVFVEYYRPKPIDWQQTLSNKDKIPYGTYILYALLPDIFQNQPIESVRLPIANRVENNDFDRSNYIFINQNFLIDSLDLMALLEYVNEGNQVFISAENYTDLIKDTLHFETRPIRKNRTDSLSLSFLHPSLKTEQPARYPFQNANYYLAFAKKEHPIILGKNSAGGINFIQIPFGKGNFYLSTVPLAFSNYHVIGTTQNKYAAQALSHLPIRPVLWDEYQKQGRLDDESVFRVLLSYEPLRWAYYITLAGLVLFVLFESQRTQRIIPILEKPRNTTLEFVQVVGNLYFNYKNHGIIADKKINYFLEFLRRHYHESTTVLDDEFREKITLKSGVDLFSITSLFNLIEEIRETDKVTERQLQQLNKKLEDFYRQASR